MNFELRNDHNKIKQKMTQIEQQNHWLYLYSVKDLCRTLVREYLYQNNFFKTLNSFECQDKLNQQKMNKSILIKMLSMSNLVIKNRSLSQGQSQRSILAILTKYLRTKFQQKVKFKNQDKKTTKSNLCQQIKSNIHQQSKSILDQQKKEFSMNGGSFKTSSQRINNNFLQQKNKFVKGDQHQTANDFYKKKSIDNIQKQQLMNQKIKKVEKTSTTGSNHRPNTAKPSILKKQTQKDTKITPYTKISSNIYQKLKSQQIEFNNGRNIAESKLNKQKQNNITEIKQNSKTSQSQNIRPIRLQIEQKQVVQLFKQSQVIKNDKEIVNNWNEFKIQQNRNKKNINNKHQNLIKPPVIQITDDYEQQFQKVQQHQKNKQIQKQEKLKNIQTSGQKKTQQILKVQIKNIEYKQIQQVSYKLQQKKQITTKNSNQKTSEQNQAQSVKNVSKLIQTTEINKSKLLDESKATNELSGINQLKGNNESTGITNTRVMRKLLKKSQNSNNKITSITQNLTERKLPDQSQNQQNQRNYLQKSQPTECRQQQNKRQIIQNKLIIQDKPAIYNKDLKQSITSTISTGNMRVIKKKVKVQQNNDTISGSSKFKFDQNFVDRPLNAHKQKYIYQKFDFCKTTIDKSLIPSCQIDYYIDFKIDYMSRPTNNSSSINLKRKSVQKALSGQRANQLKTIIFQKASCYLPKSWHQGFILSSDEATPYGLKQIQGGPCGIIAAMQCYFLKHFLFLSKPTSQKDLKNEIRRQNCLVAALSDILWKVKGKKSQKVVLIIPSNRNFSGNKLDFSYLQQIQLNPDTYETLYEAIWTYKSSFIGQMNHGVTLLVYSIVMTKGIDNIYSEVDMKQNPLIGLHGHCTQQLVNLFITGQAASNCFDGKKQLQPGFTLQGVNNKSQFGFLTVFESLDYIKVGDNLKNPILPIWIISKEFHYHVIFGNHYLISQNNQAAKFDLVYFDGLYACDKFIRLTFDQLEKDQFGLIKEDKTKIKDLPLIEQVLLKKWGKRKVNWNGSIVIL